MSPYDLGAIEQAEADSRALSDLYEGLSWEQIKRQHLEKSLRRLQRQNRTLTLILVCLCFLIGAQWGVILWMAQ